MCTYPDGRKVHSRYDTLDRLVRRFDDDGTTQYSDIGKYEYIGVWRVAVLTYQNETRLTHIGQVSSQNADVGFDTLRRIVNHRWESFTTQALGNGTLVVGFEHRDGASTPAPLYDRANNKRIEHKTHEPGRSEQYKYDSVYRLTSTGSGSQGQDARGFERGTFTSTARTSMAGNVAFFQDWDLEGLGNWARQDDNARVETRTHSDFNEIMDRVVSAHTATLTHDKNGNVTDTGYTTLGGQSFPGGGLRLEWDALNRLRKVFNNSNTPANTGDDVLVGEYTYDCENRRLRKVVTNSGSLNGTTDFYYEGWRNLEERDGSDAVTNQYVFGNYLDEAWTLDNRRNGATIANLNSSTSGTNVDRHFYHCNTLYHVYGLTDEVGQLREAYEYDAYGRQTVITDGNDGDVIVNFNANDVRTSGGPSTINGSPWMDSGQRSDSETGLYYYKNRYFSRDIGRFLSRDAERELDWLSLYEYVTSQPMKWIDPFGLQRIRAECPPGPVNTKAAQLAAGFAKEVPSITGGKETDLEYKVAWREDCVVVCSIPLEAFFVRCDGKYLHRCIYPEALNEFNKPAGFQDYHGTSHELDKERKPTGKKRKYDYDSKTGKLTMTEFDKDGKVVGTSTIDAPTDPTKLPKAGALPR